MFAVLLAAVFITATLGGWSVDCFASTPAGRFIDVFGHLWSELPWLALHLLPGALLTVLSWPFLARRIPRIEQTRFATFAVAIALLIGFDALGAIAGVGWWAHSIPSQQTFSLAACGRHYAAGVLTLGVLVAAPRLVLPQLRPGTFIASA